MDRKAIFAFGLLAALVAAGGYLALENGDTTAPRQDAPITPSANRQQESPVASPAVAAASSAAPRISPQSLPKSPFSTADPYALAQELRARRQPGTFALAVEIDRECRESVGKVFLLQSLGFGSGEFRSPGDDPQLPVSSAKLPPGTDAKRIAAMQEIQARCRPFVDDATTREPLPGDEYGLRYKSASLKTNRLSTLFKTDATEDLQELASQGVLSLGHPVLAGGESGDAYLNGQLRGGLSRDDYRRAIELAYLQVTSSEATASRPDIRSLTACMYSGLCDSLESVAFQGLPMDSPSIPAIRAVAARIATALAANDVSAFARPRP